MMTHKKIWADAEVAAMRSAGRSWAEIKKSTGLAVQDAKDAVSRHKEPVHEALRERTREQVQAARRCGECGRRYDTHRAVEYSSELQCPVRMLNGDGWDRGVWVDASVEEQDRKWRLSDPKLHGRYRTDALAHARAEAVRASQDPMDSPWVGRSFGTVRPEGLPVEKPKKVASRLRKKRLKKRDNS